MFTSESSSIAHRRWSSRVNLRRSVGIWIQYIERIDHRSEGHFTRGERGGYLTTPVKKPGGASCFECLLNQYRRNADPLPIFNCASIDQQLPGLLNGDVVTGMFKHIQACIVDRTRLILIQDAQFSRAR